MNYREIIETSPATHTNLRNAWADFKTKDPVDSLKNARCLVAACEERLAELEYRIAQETMHRIRRDWSTVDTSVAV